MSVIGQTEYVAKRHHKRPCCICGEPIRKGDAAERWCWKDCGDLYASVAHAVCLPIARRDAGPGEYEWTGRFYFEDHPREAVEECIAAVAAARKGGA